MGKHGDYPASWDDIPYNIRQEVPSYEHSQPPEESEEIDRLCHFVNTEITQLSRIIRQKAIGTMNVAQYNKKGGQGEYLPLLDAKAFAREKGKNGEVQAKILAVREIDTPGNTDKRKGPVKQPYKGLALDLKVGTMKYSFLTRMEGYDIGRICAQLDSEETDDWIGEKLRFVTNKGKNGNTTFVNVAGTGKKSKK